MTCVGIELIRFVFMQSLQKDIKKLKNHNHLEESIILMLNKIEIYLNGGVLTERCTTQSIIGMDVLFRG